MAITQDSYGFAVSYIIFWALFLIALSLFVYRGVQLLRYLKLGRNLNRFDLPWQRFRSMLGHVFSQGCVLRRVSSKDLAGIGHAFLFWGFCLFLFNYILYIFIGDGLGLANTIENTSFTRYFSHILDIAGLVIVIALIWATVRRFFLKPERLVASTEAGVILGVIFILMLAHFSLEGFRINAMGGGAASSTPGREAFASFFTWVGLGSNLQKSLWMTTYWVHYLVILGFLVYLLHSKHLHILASPFNLLFRPPRRVGSFSTIDMDSPGAIPQADIGMLHWKELLDLYSCTECGRCQVNCPATKAGTPLKPKDMVLNLKRYLLDEGDRLIKDQRPGAGSTGESPMGRNIAGCGVSEAELWACTTCGVCQEECPVIVEHIDRIISLRRSIIERGMIFGSMASCLESLQLLGNPGKYPPGERTSWIGNLPVKYAKKDQEIDFLYWIGCSGAYELKGQEISRALVDIFKTLGLNYAIIGAGEKCCGEPARRLGEEGLFQKLAKENIATLEKHRFAKIITHCPHCFNTIKNEYKDMGGEFEVVHHTEFLAELVERGRISLQGFERRVTFHDPCYLGRYNGIYTIPRKVLKAIPNLSLVEMTPHGEQAMCCGGGGGHFWMENISGQRINYMRFADVEKTKPEILVTACPFCKIMLDDACNYRKLTGEIKTQDIAELIQLSMAKE